MFGIIQLPTGNKVANILKIPLKTIVAKAGHLRPHRSNVKITKKSAGQSIRGRKLWLFLLTEKDFVIYSFSKNGGQRYK